MKRLVLSLAVVALARPAFAQPSAESNPLGRIAQQTHEVEGCRISTESTEESVKRASEHFDRAAKARGRSR